MGKYVKLFKETFTEFGEDKAPRLGAALAYYTIFSLAPLLLIAIAIAGMVFGQEAAQQQISKELGGILGQSTAKAVEEMVKNAAKPKAGMWATIIGVITLLFGASGVFGQLKDALNTIWNVKPKKTAGVMGFIRDRFLSMAMVFGVGFMLLVTLVLDAGISAMGGFLAPHIPGGEAVLQALQIIVSLGLVTVLFAMIFRFLPDTKIEWRDVWFGAAFTSFLFVIGKFALGLYLGKAAVGSSFGAAGSLIILLVWVYYAAQILFFGAEFTQVYARSHGSLQGDTSKRDARAEGQRVEDRPNAETDASGKPKGVGVPSKAGKGAAKEKSGGGAGKVAAGGCLGLLLGGLFGVITALIFSVKTVKKIVTAPFK